MHFSSGAKHHTKSRDTHEDPWARLRRRLPVPVGFVDNALSVPRPNRTLLYIKLRDDPATVSTAVLPVLPEN